MSDRKSDSSPCAACSWTPERQGQCRYNSNVKLFYGVSDRGVWSLGSTHILKERGNSPPTYEERNLQLLKEETSIPVPTIVRTWREDDRCFLFMERIPGQPLS